MMTKPKVGDWIVYPSDEVFAETTAWAVLAKQALNGDRLAKYTLIDNILCTLNLKRGKNETPVCMGNSGYGPLALTIEAMNGTRERYGNIKLDGLAEFMKKEVLATAHN